MIASTEITNPENFASTAFLVSKLLSRKEFVKTMEIVKSRLFLRKQQFDGWKSRNYKSQRD